MTTDIRKGLLNLARRIGRWIIERLARMAVIHLIGYMRGKLDDFGRRLGNAKTDRRRTWLRGRIRRWLAAVKWLEEKSAGLTGCALAEFSALAEGDAKGIPLVCERLVAA